MRSKPMTSQHTNGCTRRTFLATGVAGCLVTAGGPLVAQTNGSRRVALLVGVNHYLKPGFDDLNCCENDVKSVQSALVDLGFDEVRVLLGSAVNQRDPAASPPNAATRANILAAAEEMAAKLTKKDLMIVMLSGHGQQFRVEDTAPREDAFYCPAEAESLNQKKLVSLSYLTDEVLAKHVGKGLLLVDACRNRPKDQGKGAAKGVQGGDDVAVKQGQSVLFSCRAQQQSYEDKDKTKPSLFTSCVLEALRGEGARRGEVTWAGVVAHVTSRMASEELQKKLDGAKQEPISAGALEHTVLGRLKSAKRPRPQLLVAPFRETDAKARQQEWADYLGLPGVVDTRSAGGLPLVLIPPGEFLMGNHESAEQVLAFAKQTGWKDAKAENFADEFPRHQVRISEPFWVGQHEVTQGEFAKFVTAKGYLTEPERDGAGGWGWNKQAGKFEQSVNFDWRKVGWSPYTDNHPVVNVTWNDAMQYVAWLNSEYGGGFRLLREAEWEYCARAGTVGRFPHGEDPEGLAKIGNVADGTYSTKLKNPYGAIAARDGYVQTAPVETYLANAFGLRDMIGNVWEWCADVYDSEAYQKRAGTAPAVDPQVEDEQASHRVSRGGGWGGDPSHCRSALRGRDSPGDRLFNLGFRVARSFGA